MTMLLVLGLVLIYLVMVAQFQSLLSPFIVMATVPLAFTGGFAALWAAGEQLTMMSLMGFAVLVGTVVNNGIVFVDYVNQLRRGGLEKRDALEAAGRTRMRPILMTALTTILAMLPLVFSQQIGTSMERGMALVVVGGLAYATLMTLYIVPTSPSTTTRAMPKPTWKSCAASTPQARTRARGRCRPRGDQHAHRKVEGSLPSRDPSTLRSKA